MMMAFFSPSIIFIGTRPIPPKLHPSSSSSTSSPCSRLIPSFPSLHIHRSFLGLSQKKPPRRCVSTSAGPSSPLPEDDTNNTTGLQATLSRIEERVRVFFAVFFWMSLFFWASAWDGRDNGRKNRGSRFRR